MTAAKETDPNDNWDYRSALDKLSEESEKLRNLRELHALKVANKCQRRDLAEIKAQVKQAQNELLRLTLEVENFTGQAITRRCKVNALCSDSEDSAEPNSG